MQNYFVATPQPVLAADFDYFRLPRHRWELLLVRLRQLGANALVITVPWRFHEISQGTIDLNGTSDPRRDLHGLLRLNQKLELPCILQPGPFSSQGVLSNGLPAWLPDTLNPFEASLHPVAEGWLRAISQTLLSYQWPDGPIVALQLNNQPNLAPPQKFSRDLARIRWPIWLRKCYQSINALNTAYGTTYQTISQVEFPSDWAVADAPAAQDAREFVQTLQLETQTRYLQILAEAGWQIPVYASVQEPPPGCPPIEAWSLADLPDTAPPTKPDAHLIHLQGPIQADPDPVDIGQHPIWASNAPIGTDGAPRRGFYRIRNLLWALAHPDIATTGHTLHLSLPPVSMIACAQDVSLKIPVTQAAKPTVWRLLITGALVPATGLKFRRGQLRGDCPLVDAAGQTDLLLLHTAPAEPLLNFPLTYLTCLLTAQAETLTRCARYAERLGQRLSPSPDTAQSSPPNETSPSASRTLAEARRGLQEADAALRRATRAISGLEEGLASILGKQHPAEIAGQSDPAAPLPPPDLFDEYSREALVKAGKICARITPMLQTAAANLQQTVNLSPGFTVEQYQQSYTLAVNAAQNSLAPLLELITLFRQEIGAGRFPVVFWHIHNQIQDLAQALRLGVLRT